VDGTEVLSSKQRVLATFSGNVAFKFDIYFMYFFWGIPKNPFFSEIFNLGETLAGLEFCHLQLDTIKSYSIIGTGGW
jgi:hypothetical protein